ncbi:hypothetical protein SAMN06265827_12825 [Orenia metallireducens]|uniref:Uncharacterized protein n=1 Tax=Orenia metallireducens TaxID=1413210 RepID=A0A285I039_9FIRM|nr:hypothetical protein [Orenia metallireducens]SNY41257.1 hypothetical protein SAMN06265827_12825 [Orenia metallireducens]
MGAFGPDELDGIYGKEYYMKLFELENEGTYSFYAYENISTKKAQYMAGSFGISEYDIIGFLDLTVFNTGKKGLVFTEDELLINTDDLYERFYYRDIKKTDVITRGSGFFNHRVSCLVIYLQNGGWIEIGDNSIDAYGLSRTLENMKKEVTNNS